MTPEPTEPWSFLAPLLADLPPGRALDIAAGAGRHSLWLAEMGWSVTAYDQIPGPDHPNLHWHITDLETDPPLLQPASFDLVICWLYWQPSLLPALARCLKPSGIAALAGKSSGRFATSLHNYRLALPGWSELASGSDGHKVWIILRPPPLPAP